MTNCWEFQPSQRWSFTQIIQFLTEVTWEEVSYVKCEEDGLMGEIQQTSLTNNRMGREELGPGGIWGRVQGVGSDHWGTSSQP